MASFVRDRRLHRPRGLVLQVEGGQVVCPRRGPTDIEVCFVCPASRGFPDGPSAHLVCTGEPEREVPFLVGLP